MYFDLEHFHVNENISADGMHDLFVGVVRYDGAYFLFYLVYNKKAMSLEHLNHKINGFNYDINDKKSKPPEISAKHLQQKKFSMTAAESLCRVRILPFLVADYISVEDEHWHLILLLQDIVEFVVLKKVHKFGFRTLGTSISDYLKLCSGLFPNTMKPKHHYLVHYPRIIKLMGPALNISSF